MALRVRFQHQTGGTLGYSVERLADGLFYDFTGHAFSSSPAALIASLPEDSSPFLGRYKVNLATTSVVFTDGDYCVTVHDAANGDAVLGELAVVMHAGDDATVIPAAAGADPWAQALPGGYGAGTAGNIIGTNLNVPVATRGTFSGGAVASVTAPVTVGTNNDKTGYALSAAGLDAVPVETGVNARQALSPILAAAAGVVAGAGTGTIVIKGGNVSVTRITAATDGDGNRTTVVLALPS